MSKLEYFLKTRDMTLATRKELAEDIEWLKGYREVVGDERFLEFVASRQHWMNRACKQYRKFINDSVCG